MNDSEVLLERRGTTLWLTINRPARRNALTAGVISAIADGYRLAQADDAIRVIVITGAGSRAFCAGADLAPGENFKFDLSKPTIDYADLVRLTRSVHVPVIARVNGACVAGGMGLLAIADIAVAVEHAVFGLPEVRVGLFPMQVVALLQPLIGARVISEWALTGERFDARTAARAGLLNAVVAPEELDATVDTYVARLEAGSPTAQRRGIYAMRAMRTMTPEAALSFAESQISIAAMTDDAREGLASFGEKRPPRWRL